MDAPALNGMGNLANRLYLRVRLPDGAITNGDVSPYPTTTNNVQQVLVPNPTAGAYQIRVHGVEVIRRSQALREDCRLNLDKILRSWCPTERI